MITAVTLTHNSTATIEDTLVSLVWCDEVLIIDDNSTDDTAAIARKHHARVIQHDLRDDFSAQRNFGLNEAKGDWVLFVDADEVVSAALAAEIQKAVKDSIRDGYYLKRQDTIWGWVLRHGETSKVRLVRLGRKGAGTWVRPVHEVWAVHGYLGTLRNPILHFPHPNVAQFLRDINDYSTANAEYMYTQSVHASVWQIIAYPVAKFWVNYVWRGGFLDGTPGAIVALMMSFHSFLTRAKLWQLWQKSG